MADMFYNGNLVTADTFLRNRPNHGQTLTEKPLYSGHFFLAPCEHFGQNLLLNSRHPIIGWENRKHVHVYSYLMKKTLYPNFFCLFLPKESKTLYSGRLVI